MTFYSMNDLLLISQYFYPEMISTGHILTELLVELASRGLKNKVICGQPCYYSTEKVDPYITYKGIEIVRPRNAQYKKNSLKGKVLNSTSFFFQAFVLGLKQKKRGPVLLVTNPPILGLIGPIIKAVKKRPFILIIHDLYPDIAVNMGYLGPKSFITFCWRFLNRWIYNRSSFIVVLGRDVQRVILKQLSAKHHHKVIYIPNWADPSIIQPVKHAENPLIKQLELKYKFIVQYSGNMGLTHDMETIIEAAKVLRAKARVHFLLIGGGGKLRRIKEMIRSYDLTNVTLLPYHARENLKYSLGSAHVSLISLEKGATGLSVPSKLYGIMASGRPAIAIMDEDSEVALTLKEFRCGFVTPPKDVNALVQSITWLMSHETERRSMGKRAYDAFLSNYTVKLCAAQYHDLLYNMMFENPLSSK